MGDYIYAISHGGVTVTHLDDLNEVATLQLPYNNPYEDRYAYAESSEDKADG